MTLNRSSVDGLVSAASRCFSIARSALNELGCLEKAWAFYIKGRKWFPGCQFPNPGCANSAVGTVSAALSLFDECIGRVHVCPLLSTLELMPGCASGYGDEGHAFKRQKQNGTEGLRTNL